MNIGQYLQGICTTTNLLIRVVLNFGRTSPLCYRILFRIIYLVKLYGCSFVSVAFALFFHPRICMDVYAGNYRKESISFSSVDAHGMQMVIVQDAVVYPFAGCAVFIDFFIFPCSSGSRRIKAHIPFRFCIDTPSIWGFGAFIPARTIIHFVAGRRAAPSAPAAAGTVTPVCHPVTGLAYGRSILIDYNSIRNGLWHAAVSV